MRNNTAPALSNPVKPDKAMKPKNFSPRRDGFNSLDLLVMLLAVAVVGLVFLPTIVKRRAPAGRINCVNNLKQVGLSFRLWGGDNGDKYPSQVSTNLGGTMELLTSGSVFPIFMVMSNELGTPKIIVCPSDTMRQFAADFGKITDTNLSYFVVPEADETIPDLWLSGDRNLATNNVTLKPGLFMMPTNHVLGWSSQMHQNAGNIAMADGSVHQYLNTRLPQSAAKALSAHYLATTNATFRIAIP